MRTDQGRHIICNLADNHLLPQASISYGSWIYNSGFDFDSRVCKSNKALRTQFLSKIVQYLAVFLSSGPKKDGEGRTVTIWQNLFHEMVFFQSHQDIKTQESVFYDFKKKAKIFLENRQTQLGCKIMHETGK
ncbi:hypothetical protein KC734_02980 [candidate division KSB1 bacterium]|nr:hypothetical protein [candidate division KSB1 bacterium]